LRILRFQKNHELVFTERWQRPYGATCYKPARQPPLKKRKFWGGDCKRGGLGGKEKFSFVRRRRLPFFEPWFLLCFLLFLFFKL